MEIIIAGLVLLPFYLLFSAFRDGFQLMKTVPAIRKVFLSHGRRQSLLHFLEQFSYYKNLSPQAREIFYDRSLHFCLSKEFRGQKGLVVTDEIKFWVSSCATQLTFGLRHFKLFNIETIHVFPETFYSPNGKMHFKGAFSKPDGRMYLSWKDFLHGYKVDDDKYNLACMK